MALAGNANPRTRTRLYPLLLLGGIALTVFLVFYLIDWALVKSSANPFRLLFAFDVDTLQNAPLNMAQVVAVVAERAAQHGVGTALAHKHGREQGAATAHLGLRHDARNTVATLDLVVGLGRLAVYRRVEQVDALAIAT